MTIDDEWDDVYPTIWEPEADPFDEKKLAAYAVAIDAPDGPIPIGRIVAPFPPTENHPGWIWRAIGGAPNGIADSWRKAVLKMAVYTAITMPNLPDS